MNLKQIRKENVEQLLIESLEKNVVRTFQAEMDILNLVCENHVQFLPLNNLCCSYCYDLYETEEDMSNDLVYSREELIDSMLNPIQLHYAAPTKPWNDLSSTKAEEWFITLAKTNFLKDFLYSKRQKVSYKNYIDLSVKVSKKRELYLHFGQKKYLE